jgi:shikimate dehydrogenase
MRKFGLIGKQLGHSFSKAFFTEKFQDEHLSAVYDNVELSEINEIKAVIDTGSFSGMNVTIPYKEAVIPYLDELSDEAKAIGAVNVIAFQNGKTIGHNTDAFGFHQSIKPFLTNRHERALILGTGGASKAVAYVFQSIGLDVIYVSRNPQGAKQFGYSDINEHMLNACKVIVNCTPVGTFPNVDESIPFPYQQLTEEHLVIDLIYNPAQTQFLAQSAAAGATTLNGLSMLKEQANKAWQIWTT